MKKNNYYNNNIIKPTHITIKVFWMIEYYVVTSRRGQPWPSRIAAMLAVAVNDFHKDLKKLYIVWFGPVVAAQIQMLKSIERRHQFLTISECYANWDSPLSPIYFIILVEVCLCIYLCLKFPENSDRKSRNGTGEQSMLGLCDVSASCVPKLPS